MTFEQVNKLRKHIREMGWSVCIYESTSFRNHIYIWDKVNHEDVKQAAAYMQLLGYAISTDPAAHDFIKDVWENREETRVYFDLTQSKVINHEP